MLKVLWLVCLLPLVACGSDESTSTEDAGSDAEFIRPIQDVGGPQADAGLPDADLEPDQGNSTLDMGFTCECTKGLTRCQGTQVQYCVQDPNRDSCGVWEPAVDCASPQQTCIVDRCDFPQGCVDNDQDGYGINCPQGPDCDDNEAMANPGGTEICDNIDNDCNGTVDNGFNIGGSCSMGSGQCAATGVYICTAAGQQECMITGMATGSPETCDGLDNDCDMLIDEDGACDLCMMDPNDPNETPATATPLVMNIATVGLTCPGDEESFAIPTTPNKVYRVNVNFYNALSDLDLELFENGVKIDDSTGSNDFESIQFTAGANKTYAARVVNYDNKLNLFRIAAVDIIPCALEDTFYPNGTRETSAFLFPGWVAQGHVCDAISPTRLSDWFDIGSRKAGDVIDILLYDLDGYGDLDLFLLHDPDGDGTFTLAASSAFDGTDEDITFTVPSDGPYFIEVYDYGGVGAFYDLEYDVN